MLGRVTAEEGVGALWAGAGLSLADSFAAVAATAVLDLVSSKIDVQLPPAVIGLLQSGVTAPIELASFVAQTRREIERNPHLSQHLGKWMQNMNVTGMDAFAAMATATLIQVLGSTPAHLISERVADLVDPLLGALQGQFASVVIRGGVISSLAIIPTYPLSTMAVTAKCGLPLRFGSYSTWYAGLVPSLAGIFAYRAAYYAADGAVRTVVTHNSSPMVKMVAGLSCGVVASLASYPFETLRMRAIIASVADDILEDDGRPPLQVRSTLSP